MGRCHPAVDGIAYGALDQPPRTRSRLARSLTWSVKAIFG
jgi:hypothetical protein